MSTPQWIDSAVAEMWSEGCEDMRARDREIIARHYAAEGARVQELQEAADYAEIVLIATEKTIKRLCKALGAWEK